LSASLGTVCLLIGGAFQILLGHTLTKQASAMSVEPELIVLDATEGREHALLGVDAHITGPEAPAHGFVLREGLCSLRTDSGVHLLRLHLEHVIYKGPSKAHLDIELEHDSIQDMRLALRRASGATVLECDLGIDVSLFHLPWALPARHSLSIPLGSALGKAASGFRARLLRESSEVVLPTLRNLTTAVDVKARLELSVPSGPSKELLSLLGSAPVQVKAGVTFAEEGVKAVEARLGVDDLLQHWTEGSGPGAPTVFALPAQVAFHGDGAAMSAMLSAVFAGEQAELRPQAGQHYRIRPSMQGRRPEHSVLFAATSPKCALARALGSVHSVRLQSDERPGAPTLAESWVQGRQLLERKLSGATLEGYALQLHERLFLDDSFAMRVDLDVRGGDLAQPALQASAGLMLRMAGDEDGEDEDSGSSDSQSGNSSWQHVDSGNGSWQHSGDMDTAWEYSATAVAFTARMVLDLDSGAFSGDFTEAVVVDSTESRQSGGEERWAEGVHFNGPAWEHKVTHIRARGSASYDGTSKSLRAGMDMGFSEFKHLLVGIMGAEYNWTHPDNNPSQAVHEPFPLMGHGRRLLEAASKAGGTAGQVLEKAASAARRLAERFEDSESHSLNVSLEASMDLDGVGDGNVFDFDFSLRVLGELSAQCNWTVVEVSAENYTHNVFLELQTSGMASFKLGQQLAPTASGGTDLRIDSFNPDERVALDMGMSATASVVTDLSRPSKLRVHGSLSILPDCAVAAGEDVKLQSLQALNVSVSASNPQCRQCSTSGDSDGWHVRSLHVGCGEEQGPNASAWRPAASCCVYDDELLGNAFGESRMSMGSTWTDRFSFELSRSDNLLDLFGWLENDMEIPQVAEGLPKRMNATYSIVAGSTVRTWLFSGDEGPQARVELTEAPRQRGGTLWGLTVWEGGERALEASLEVVNESGAWGVTFREVPPNSTNDSAELLLLYLEEVGDSCSLRSHVKTGASLEQRFALTGRAVSVGERFDASVTVFEAEKLGSAELAVEDPEGLGMSVRVTVRDEADQQAGLLFANLQEATDRLTCTGFVEDAVSRKGSLEAFAERLNNGDLLRAEVKVRDENNTVKLGISGSFAKAPSSGTVDAVVSMDGNAEAANVRGSLPRVRGFYVGDIAVTADGQTEALWVNCSEGWLPSAPRDGLSGFERMQVAVGAVVEEATRLNLSAYIEAPPFGEGLSGCGVAAQVEERGEGRQRLDASIDLELPFEMAGVSEDGSLLQVVEEVVQEVSAEVVLDDVTAFDAEAYKQEMARAADIDLSLVEIESIDYKVEVEYTFPEAVSEAEAKDAVAMANSVRPSQVTVIITDAGRRLVDVLAAATRRLQSVDVQATIQAESAASVGAIKTTAQSTSALSEALQATANRTLAAAVKVAPTSKVAVITKMHSAVAPVLDAAALQTVGAAVGGTVEVTDVRAATVMALMSAPVTTTPGTTTEFHGIANLAFPAAVPLVPLVVWLLPALAGTLRTGGRASLQ